MEFGTRNVGREALWLTEASAPGEALLLTGRLSNPTEQTVRVG